LARHETISAALVLIFQGIEQLSSAFPGRAFTIDGRLVGDIGEVIAALEYDVILDDLQQPIHDGSTSDGRRVQIKATFKERLNFKTASEYYLGFKLDADGSYEEVFNGPGSIIRDHFSHRRGIERVLLSFPVSELRKLAATVEQKDRIPKRRI
jgi:hypothetical protein